ncbi:MAG: hypothetical protein WD066_00890 [Planctomycetaceae bacterium]
MTATAEQRRYAVQLEPASASRYELSLSQDDELALQIAGATPSLAEWKDFVRNRPAQRDWYQKWYDEDDDF